MEEKTLETVATEEVTTTPDAPVAYLVKKEDGYHVVDADGTVGDVCKFDKTGESIALTPNAANRQWIMRAKADKFFDENPDGMLELPYRATRHIGERTAGTVRIPNQKLIAYLSEEEQAEYNAIMQRAIDARAAEIAANKKPAQTKKDKLLAKIAKLEAEIAALEEPTDNN